MKKDRTFQEALAEAKQREEASAQEDFNGAVLATTQTGLYLGMVEGGLSSSMSLELSNILTAQCSKLEISLQFDYAAKVGKIIGQFGAEVLKRVDGDVANQMIGHYAGNTLAKIYNIYQENKQTKEEILGTNN